MKFTESIVENAALSWMDELKYSVLHGPEIAPGELHAERADFGIYIQCYTKKRESNHSIPHTSNPIRPKKRDAIKKTKVTLTAFQSEMSMPFMTTSVGTASTGGGKLWPQSQRSTPSLTFFSHFGQVFM